MKIREISKSIDFYFPGFYNPTLKLKLYFRHFLRSEANFDPGCRSTGGGGDVRERYVNTQGQSRRGSQVGDELLVGYLCSSEWSIFVEGVKRKTPTATRKSSSSNNNGDDRPPFIL